MTTDPGPLPVTNPRASKPNLEIQDLVREIEQLTLQLQISAADAEKMVVILAKVNREFSYTRTEVSYLTV